MPEPTSITTHFQDLPDPRVPRTRRHALHDILVITVCATICGADDWAAIARFGRAKRTWFRGFLALPHGIPAHERLAVSSRRWTPRRSRARFSPGSRRWWTSAPAT